MHNENANEKKKLQNMETLASIMNNWEMLSKKKGSV